MDVTAGEDGRPQSGFFCSTSQTFFSTKEELATHYRSDFHRYNLKRKVRALPNATPRRGLHAAAAAPLPPTGTLAHEATPSCAPPWPPPQVAGLSPVTLDWFEARKAQLAASAASAASDDPGMQRIWVDPLTKKKFLTEATYQAHTRSARGPLGQGGGAAAASSTFGTVRR
jgi:pre-60S factor REI1